MVLLEWLLMCPSENNNGELFIVLSLFLRLGFSFMWLGINWKFSRFILMLDNKLKFFIL